MVTKDNKGDQIIWYLMVTAISILILGGGAWATSIDKKVEKISSMEVNITYMQEDLSQIKQMMMRYIGGK